MQQFFVNNNRNINRQNIEYMSFNLRSQYTCTRELQPRAMIQYTIRYNITFFFPIRERKTDSLLNYG